MKYIHRYPRYVGERVMACDGVGTVIKIGTYNHEGHQWCQVKRDDGVIVEGTGFNAADSLC